MIEYISGIRTKMVCFRVIAWFASTWFAEKEELEMTNNCSDDYQFYYSFTNEEVSVNCNEIMANEMNTEVKTSSKLCDSGVFLRVFDFLILEIHILRRNHSSYVLNRAVLLFR